MGTSWGHERMTQPCTADAPTLSEKNALSPSALAYTRLGARINVVEGPEERMGQFPF